MLQEYSQNTPRESVGGRRKKRSHFCHHICSRCSSSSSHHLSKSCHIYTGKSLICCKSSFSWTEMTKCLGFFFFFAFMEMDWKGLNNFSCEVCRSLAIPLFCHCQFVFLFDMHVICIMHICRPALTHSLIHSPSLCLSLSVARSYLKYICVTWIYLNLRFADWVACFCQTATTSIPVSCVHAGVWNQTERTLMNAFVPVARTLR